MTSAWGTNHCCRPLPKQVFEEAGDLSRETKACLGIALWTCCMLRQRSNSLRTPSIASTSSNENSLGWAQGQIRPAKSGIHRARRTLRGGGTVLACVVAAGARVDPLRD